MDNRKSAVHYKKITVRGVVQGVGFRPAVYRLAVRHHILGTVKNTGGAVEIFASGTDETLNMFIDSIKNSEIPFASIESLKTEDTKSFFADTFEIIESDENKGGGEIFISPDLSVCEKCLSELKDEQNRRHGHYFNTCVSCGPRFSVIEGLPYDRENTSMGEFPMCPDCGREYTSPDDRRFHAETIACNDCGPKLIYRTQNGTYSGDEAFNRVIEAVKNGGIVAIKGIGGFHLACSPYSEIAAANLRKLKGRDKKPFAVMFYSLDEIKRVCEVSPKEEELLRSSPRPITLLRIKDSDFADEVLCGDLRCGCFLPYTPLHYLLMREMKVLTLTSANVSGSAIIKDDGEMLEFFKNADNLLAGVLYHERKILRSIEDSVAQCVGENNVQIIRRSRGYAPQPFFVKNRHQRPFLAMGGDLKSSFCLVKGNHAYMSQYFGDLEDEGANRVYEASIADYKGLFNCEPELVVCDMHPGYFSTARAKTLGLPVLEVQHHHAHTASVMAEHKLEGRILGVAFDGTGCGDDGNLWGGEFLLCDEGGYKRAGHMSYTKILGGDSAAKDAKKTAACFLYESGIDAEKWLNAGNGVHAGNSLDAENVIDGGIIKAALDNGVNTAKSSSMGRLFDAAASLTGLCHKNGYEGQCAILLQQSAEKARRNNINPCFMEFGVSQQDGKVLISSREIIRLLYEQCYLNKQADSGAFALGFHIAVANMVEKTCRVIRDIEHVSTVALSGGVFQNALLLELCLDLLNKAGFNVFINNYAPPNDGGISLGQAYIGGRR